MLALLLVDSGTVYSFPRFPIWLQIRSGKGWSPILFLCSQQLHTGTDASACQREACCMLCGHLNAALWCCCQYLVCQAWALLQMLLAACPMPLGQQSVCPRHEQIQEQASLSCCSTSSLHAGFDQGGLQEMTRPARGKKPLQAGSRATAKILH